LGLIDFATTEQKGRPFVWPLARRTELGAFTLGRRIRVLKRDRDCVMREVDWRLQLGALVVIHWTRVDALVELGRSPLGCPKDGPRGWVLIGRDWPSAAGPHN